MARWFIRKPTFSKVLGAYRSQFRRALMRLFFPWSYGKKGIGWLRSPKKAAYNWWYHRTSVSLVPRSKGGAFSALLTGLLLLPFSRMQTRSSSSSSGTGSSTSSGTGTSASSGTGTSTSSGTGTSASSGTGTSTSSGTGTSTSSGTGTSTYSAAETARPAKTDRSSPDETAPPSAKPKKSVARPVAKGTTHPAFRSGRTPTKKSLAASPVLFQTVPPSPPTTPRITPPTVTQVSADPEDETLPRSTPRDPADRYIRKRMLIAGTSFADQTAVGKLTTGAHLDLIAEPDAPHDPNAVALYHQGGKVGYVSKQDALSFAMCLRLNRPVYGVVTDIRQENDQTVYEYETWFATH